MAPESSIAGLNGTYRTAGTYRGQTGTPWPASTRAGENVLPGQGGWKRVLRNELRGTELWGLSWPVSSS
jgi:hypothetical protein